MLGDILNLKLSLHTEKENRFLASQDIQIECIELDTALSNLSIGGVTVYGFDPEIFEYSINDFHAATASIAGDPHSPAAIVKVIEDVGGGIVHLPNIGRNDVHIEVTAPHESQKSTYILHIARNAASSSKSITNFSLAGIEVSAITNPAAKGIITTLTEFTGTIDIIVPYNALSLDSIAPTFSFIGASVDPASETARDFTSTQTYVVTAPDDSICTYTVHVARAELESISIKTQPSQTEFPINGTFSVAGLAVWGLDNVGNTFDVTSDCEAITPPDMTRAGTYYIEIRYHGKTTTLTVTVKNNAKEITGFTLAGRPGLIAETGETTGTVTVVVPYDTNLSNIAPVFFHTGVLVEPASEMSHNFETPKSYVISAADGTTRTYTVTVNREGQGSITISFSGLPEDESTALTGVQNSLSWAANTPMTVTVPSPLADLSGVSYQWYRDGTEWAGKIGSSIAVTARQFTMAMGHQISVKITTGGGVVYTKSLTFDVVN